MTLRINMTTGSQQLADSPIVHAITALAATVKSGENRGQVPTSPQIEISFLLPGKLDKPEFTGMRMVCYDSDPNTLTFERVVPEHILHSPDSVKFVALVMQDVVDNARDYYLENGVLFDYQRWKTFATGMGAHLTG